MKKHILLFIRVAVSLGLIGYILYQINSKHDLSELPAYYADARFIWLVGAVFLLLMLLVAGSLRWGLLLAAQNVKLSPLSVFMYYMIGMFFNSFLPSTVGGDVVKVYYLSKFTGKGAESFVSVALDRVMGMAGLCVVALAALLFGGRSLRLMIGTEKTLLIVAIVGGLSLVLLLFFLMVFSEKAMRFFLNLVRWEKIKRKIVRLQQAVYIYKGRFSVLFGTLLISVVIWVVIVIVAWMVYLAFQSRIGFIPIEYFFLFIPPISVIMSLPISFGGLGTREASFIFFFHAVGVRVPDALMISLNFYFVFLISSLAGGLIYVLKDQLHFHREEIGEVGRT